MKLQVTTFPDIIVFDEILDSSIDTTGLENLLKIIRSKQREDDSKIFLITHRSEINDLDIDNSYTIKKIDGYSQVITT
jgi:Fe-S cluster assembly ATPase SufC